MIELDYIQECNHHLVTGVFVGNEVSDGLVTKVISCTAFRCLRCDKVSLIQPADSKLVGNDGVSHNGVFA